MSPLPPFSSSGSLQGPAGFLALVTNRPRSGSGYTIQKRPAWWRRAGAQTPPPRCGVRKSSSGTSLVSACPMTVQFTRSRLCRTGRPGTRWKLEAVR
nr:hypothetical protein [Glycomyces artemisiae]